MAKIPGTQYLAEAFKAYGVTHFFHVPVIVPGAMKEMIKHGITPVMCHGEKAAAYMADGYARVSGKPGVCGAQTIGATNLAAGLRDAYLARVPLIALTGGKTVPGRYRLVYQEIDDMPVYEALTKFNAVVESPSRLPDLLATAFRSATSGMPLPVHLELGGLAGEASLGEIETNGTFDTRYTVFPAVRTPAPEADVAAAFAALLKAKRPVIVAGGGVMSSGAQSELAVFARTLSIPVACAANAKGALLDADPLCVGVVGEYSRESANMAVAGADLVFFIGSQTGGLATRNWTVPPPKTKVIHCDIEAENVGRNFADTLPLVGDAKTVLGQLLAKTKTAKAKPNKEWLAKIAAWRAEWAAYAKGVEFSKAAPMRPETLVRAISDALPKDAIVVADTGHASAWGARHLYATSEKQRFIRAHGSLGWSFPAALGAKCAAPRRPVICFTGDGGFYYHLSELETALRYDLNVIVVVNNNASLNQELHLWQENTKFERNWKFARTDFAAVAESFGCLGLKVGKPSEIAPAMKTALAAKKPVVIEAATDMWIQCPPSWGPAGSVGMYGAPNSSAQTKKKKKD